MRYILCLLGILLTLPAWAQKPARRGRNVQEVVIDTSRWGFVKIAPAPRAQPVPLVFNPAKPDTTAGGVITKKDTLATALPTNTTVAATGDISPLASLIAKNDSALAVTKPATVPATLTGNSAPPTATATVSAKPGAVSSTVVAAARPGSTLATPKPVATPAEKKMVPGKPTPSTPQSASAVAVRVAGKPVSGSIATAKPMPMSAATTKPAPGPARPVSLSVSVSAAVPPISTTSAAAFSSPAPPPVVPAPTGPATRTDAPARLTFSERFDDNHNFWADGTINGYTYELAPFYNSYFIRRDAAKRNPKPALTFVNLPAGIDLNRAESFTISLDVIVPKASPFDGGLVFGAQNDKNYCHFQLRGEKEASIKWVANGGNMASYMPGTYLPTGKLIQPLRNTLRVVKEKEQLHFYINDRELQESPYDFRQFRGNKIGLISSGDAIKFQNLTVVVSPAR